MWSAALVPDLRVHHLQIRDSRVFTAAAGVAGVQAPLVVGNLAPLLSAARHNPPASLPGPREAVPLRTFPPRNLSDGFLALHAAV